MLKSPSSPAILFNTILIRSVPETTLRQFPLPKQFCVCVKQNQGKEKSPLPAYTNTRDVPTNNGRLPKGFQGFILSQKTPLFFQRLFSQIRTVTNILAQTLMLCEMMHRTMQSNMHRTPKHRGAAAAGIPTVMASGKVKIAQGDKGQDSGLCNRTVTDDGLPHLLFLKRHP